MAKPNLLLCFDAFGTLFNPRGAVSKQYAEIARACGITNFTDEELQTCLSAAIAEEKWRNPNYGKATGLGATKWWTNVIHKTFAPLLQNNQPLPSTLVPKLMHRFSSSEGYKAEPDLVSTLRTIRYQTRACGFDKVIIGVITNSDDRVPSILSSLGLKIAPFRYGSTTDDYTRSEEQNDIDFHCMSYDVGVEKPDKSIFDAADIMLSRIIAPSNSNSSTESPLNSWQKVYVGDEYAKDVVGALNSGWNPVLLDVEGHATELPSLENCPQQTLKELFEQHDVVKVRSLQGLAVWLANAQ